MMKNMLLLFLITWSFLATAQNYKGVVTGDTTYYAGGEYYTPLPWEMEYIPNLLRAIWIKDAQLTGPDSVFTFYPSIRRDHNTTYCVDTTGPTWLGKGFTRKPDGTEIYQNYKNEGITLRCLAPLNDTWKIITDSAGTEIWGTVSQLGITQIDNTADSIKEITLQAVVAGNPVTHSLNGKKIILSKEHGFFRTFEFYIFPYEDVGGGFNFNDYFPVDTSSYQRVGRQATLKNHYRYDFQSMFSPGTKWQYTDSLFFSDNGNTWILNLDHIQDSVMAKNLISADTLVVIKNRIKVTHGTSGQGPPPNNSFTLPYISTTSSTVNDTIVQNTSSPNLGLIRAQLLPEYTHGATNGPIGPGYNVMPGYRFSRIKDSIYLLAELFTNDHPIYFNPNFSCFTAVPVTIAGLIYDNKGLIPHANFLEYYHFATNGFSGGVSNVRRAHLHYYKDGMNSGLTWGTSINLIALDVEEVSRSEMRVEISPNPSQSGVYKINSSAIVSWEVFDLHGLKILEGNSSEINLQSASKGMYLLKLQSNNISFYNKLLR